MEGIIQTDEDGFVTYWSKEAEEIFGYKSFEVSGWTLNTFIHSIEKMSKEKRSSLVLENLLERIVKGKETITFSTINLRSDLKAFANTVSIGPYEDGTQGIITTKEDTQMIKEYNALVDVVKDKIAAVLSKDGKILAVNGNFALFAKLNRMRLLNRSAAGTIAAASYHDLSEEFDDELEGYLLVK